MTFVLENLRLRDLVAIVRQNQAFHDEFVRFLSGHGYPDVHAFVKEANDAKAVQVLESYLASQSEATLLDGIGRPYADTIAKWYFLAWILRDAPAQRLGPLLRSVDGDSLDKKKAALLNQLRKFVGPLFPEAAKWEWPVLSEVMLARLEGSRRALKGTHFETLVRDTLRAVFKAYRIPLTVGDSEKRINEETYDVQVSARRETVLLPVKTRETMGAAMRTYSRATFTSQSRWLAPTVTSAFRSSSRSRGVATWSRWAAITTSTFKRTPTRPTRSHRRCAARWRAWCQSGGNSQEGRNEP